MLIDILLDAAIDCLKMLPFLLVAFIMVEWVEHRAGHMFEDIMEKTGKAGPLAGTLLGCIPQCGFSVLSADLYAAGIISMGTLLSVFLATSDEAILILMSDMSALPLIGRLILCKIVIGMVAGFAINALTRGKFDKEIHELCTDCGCDEHGGILKPAIKHTAKIMVFLFVVTFAINFIMEVGAEEYLEKILLTESIWQPFLTGLVGLIPNCAASVVITRLLMEGSISFGGAVAGLSSGAGVGLLVLFRINKSPRENFTILGLLYIISVVGGMIISYL